jgi:hypothetical protein
MSKSILLSFGFFRYLRTPFFISGALILLFSLSFPSNVAQIALEKARISACWRIPRARASRTRKSFSSAIFALRK